MRIVVSNPYQDRRGGVETYVERLLALLAAAGHDVVAAFDLEPQVGWPRLVIPQGVRSLTIATDGLGATIRAINALDDAVVLANSLESLLFPVDRLVDCPVAYYAHTYVGCCINGLRINRRPEPHPCDKVFGPGCLASYFPRRCGGRNPLSMLRAYRLESARRGQLAIADLVVANSDAVTRQLAAGGIAAETLHPFVGGESGEPRDTFRVGSARSLVFLGRFEDYKGGDQLLLALPHLVRTLNVPIRLTMAGDGTQRVAWTKRAASISASDVRIRVDFPGWLSDDGVGAIFASSDLLVIPSMWPEPFGLVGLEAARFGLPVAAFAVGGIPEWLTDGVNGHVANGWRCSPRDLAEAMANCLTDPISYRKLSVGAVERRDSFSATAHVQKLTGLVDRLLER